MGLVIKVISENVSDVFANIQTLNNKINLILAIKRVNPSGFLQTEKSHIVQVVAKSVSRLSFVFGYVKKNKPPFFIPLCRLWDFDVFVAIGKRPFFAVII